MAILKNLSNKDLNQLYEFGSFFVLNHVPIGTQFSIDGSLWLTGSKFQGVKLIPPGFHIITVSPNPKPSTSTQDASYSLEKQHWSTNEAFKIGYELRNGLIRFFRPKEKAIRDYDPKAESFKSNDDSGESPPESSSQEIITSFEYMKSIDSNLAPYPFDEYEKWRSITNLITIEQVRKIIGFNNQGDAVLDSATCNHEDLSPHTRAPRSSSGHQASSNRSQWGRPRNDSNVPSIPKEVTTFWPFIDLKRSWPKGAIGPELSKWSRDKSWLLNHVMHHEFKDDRKELLGLVQLSFVTFIEIQSIPSFEFYQTLLNLISQSSLEELMTIDSKEIGGGNEEVLGEQERGRKKINYLVMRLELIKVFGDQLKYLKSNFFSESMEDFQIENWFCKILNRFRIDLKWICGNLLKETDAIHQHQKTSGVLISNSLGLDELEGWLKEIDWPGIQSDSRRFDWNVKNICKLLDGEKAQLKCMHQWNCKDSDEDEDEDEDDDDDDDDDELKPVLVQMT